MRCGGGMFGVLGVGFGCWVWFVWWWGVGCGGVRPCMMMVTACQEEASNTVWGVSGTRNIQARKMSKDTAQSKQQNTKQKGHNTLLSREDTQYRSQHTKPSSANS